MQMILGQTTSREASDWRFLQDVALEKQLTKICTLLDY
jgi:hypothetical protein